MSPRWIDQPVSGHYHLVKPLDYDTIATQLERIFWVHRERDDPKK